MVDLGFVFNANEYDDFENFKLLEPGDYNYVITDSSMDENKTGTGRNLVFTFELTEEFPGLKLKDYLPVINASEKAQKIARQKLATIQRMSGFNGVLTDSNQLHGREICLSLDVEENEWKGQTRKKNVIKGYKKKGTGVKRQKAQKAEVEMDNLDMIF